MKNSNKKPSLSSLSPNKGARKTSRRIGRGEGSGAGKTSGRGGKGQTARTGGKVKLRFEGGQVPLYKRIPKFGFSSRKRVVGKNLFLPVKVGQLSQWSTNEVIDLTLELKKSKNQRIKIVAGGTLDKKLTVKAFACTKAARLAIENAGGTISIEA